MITTNFKISYFGFKFDRKSTYIKEKREYSERVQQNQIALDPLRVLAFLIKQMFSHKINATLLLRFSENYNH